MRGNRAPEILKPNPKTREMELACSEQAEKQLADMGITRRLPLAARAWRKDP